MVIESLFVNLWLEGARVNRKYSENNAKFLIRQYFLTQVIKNYRNIESIQ